MHSPFVMYVSVVETAMGFTCVVTQNLSLWHEGTTKLHIN
jgi:hypothetical protein